jgi:hypothetical protein
VELCKVLNASIIDFSVEVVNVVFPESLSVEIFRGNDGVSTAYARRRDPTRWRKSKNFFKW